MATPLNRKYAEADATMMSFSPSAAQRMLHRRLVSTSTYFTTWRYDFIVITLVNSSRFITQQVEAIHTSEYYFGLFE